MILVTGGSGFIGRNLVRSLLEDGEEILIADIAPPPPDLSELYVKVDLLNFREAMNVVNKAETVYHLAANSSPRIAEETPDIDLKLNVLCMLNVLRSMVGKNGKLIFTSTAQVYGTPNYSPIDELHPTEPTNNYGISKLTAESYIRKFSGKKLDYTILRLFNVYGPNQSLGFVVPDITDKVRKRPEKLPVSSPKATRDFVYVEDVVEALKRVRNAGSSETFNVGSGKATKILDLAKLIVKALDVDIELVPLPGGEEIFPMAANIKKIRTLGWRPKTTLEKGINRYVSFLERTQK